MPMTVDSIRKVDDMRTHLLLKEARFPIIGKLYELLSPEELKQQRTSLIKGFDNDDILSEGGTVNRTVAELVEAVNQDIPFKLANYTDARLIYTIIDTFLQAQARHISMRLGGIQDFMIDDFANLTKLANVMLEYIDMDDRINLMNAPVSKEEKYVSIFDIMIGDKADANHEVVNEDMVESQNDAGYQSPFTNIIKQRQLAKKTHLNRIDRFKF